MSAAHDAQEHFAHRDGYGWGVDAEELRRFFLEYEATIGFSSTFSAMLAAKEGIAIGSGPPANWDPYAKIVHKLTEAKTVYQRLKRMDEDGHRREVVVLWRLYGPRNHRAHRALDFGKDALSDVAALLAPYTDAAEEARTDTVYRESSTREERTASMVAKSQRETCDELERMFWQEARLASKLEAELERVETLQERETREQRAKELDDEIVAVKSQIGPLRSRSRRAHLDAQLRRLTRERSYTEGAVGRRAVILDRLAAGRELMSQIVETVRYDGTLRARLGAIESTDREITVEDAIRRVLDHPRTKNKDVVSAWKESRARFVLAVRIEANQMRRDVHEAYRAAKRGTS